jgi:hypothetical protein
VWGNHDALHVLFSSLLLAPAAVKAVTISGTLQYFHPGTDALRQISAGQRWTTVNMGGTATSAVSLARDGSGRRYAGVRNSANGISVIGETSSGWGTWTGLGGVAMGFSSSTIVDPTVPVDAQSLDALGGAQ